MASKNTRYTREFSYTRPIMYQGEAYPSADSVITDEYGNQSNGQIFADAYGQYYTKDKGNNIFPVMPVENLDEVTISAPRKRDNLSEAFSRFLALGNDNTQVNNLPHREYNTSLKANAERGAREHALWDKEHPNLSVWRDAATSVPFAVAATPFVAGGGSALLNTCLGQAAKHGIAAIMENPYVAGANDAIGLGFAGKSAYDVSQGKFTPETAMDLVGGLGLMAKGSSMFDRMLTARKPINRVADTKNAKPEIIFGNDGMPIGGTSEGVDTSDWVDVDLGDLSNPNFITLNSLKGKKRIPKEIKKEAARKYTEFINSKDYQNRLQRAGLEDHWDYMKNLTDRRVNGRSYITGEKYFPSHVRSIINNNPRIEGQSGIVPFLSANGDLTLKDSSYGITLKENLPPEKIMSTLMHEIAHWATGNAGTILQGEAKNPAFLFRNPEPIVDIMKQNESIVPNISLAEYMDKNIPADLPQRLVNNRLERYYYLKDPQEKRARAMTIYQQAKDMGLSTDEFIDSYTENGEITKYAPDYLKDMGKILTVDNLKKYLKNFLSVASPIGIATGVNINNKQNEYR